MKHYDIIIIGSGMVGLTLAALLSKHHFSVAIIESKNTEENNTNLTARVSAIHQHSAKLFQYLDCWDLIPKSLINGMEIWDHTQQAQLQFEHNNNAWIIENRAITDAVEKNISDVDFYRPRTPKHFSSEKILTLDDNTELKTDLLVGADGANSWVRDQMQTRLHQKSYEQKAIIAVIQTELPHHQRAYQKFLTTGPIALLPLQNPHHTALVWSSDHPVSDNLMKISEENFATTLTEALDFKLGKLSVITLRQQFPLIMRHVDNYVDHNIALVGDAAHTIHPLAGLGVNLGLMDAATLTETLIQSRDKKKLLGDYRELRRYARCRKSQNTCIIDAMRVLKEVFAIDHVIVSAARGFVVNTINQHDSFKTLFEKIANGSANEIPSFLKKDYFDEPGKRIF